MLAGEPEEKDERSKRQKASLTAYIMPSPDPAVFQSMAEQEPQLEIHYSHFVSETARKEGQKGGSK